MMKGGPDRLFLLFGFIQSPWKMRLRMKAADYLLFYKMRVQ